MTEQAKTIEQTFAKEKGKLFGFIRKFVPSKEDAEDILQDVFYQFISYSNIELIERANSWLFKTAKNKIIDSSRKKKPMSFSETIVEDFDDEEAFSIEDFLPSIDITPENLFLNDEFNEKFDEALSELPAEQRDVFLMNEVDGLSFNEISELTGLSVNTLLSRKHYAVKQLKKKLNKYLNR
jgi:RNA polymerase sigma factor (sigma-70 family)